jgi:glutathione S-transferase
MLTLYHNDASTCSQKVRFTLAEKGLDWESRTLDLRAGDQQTPEYLALNPNGVVPTLVDDGKVIVESTVINEYIDDAVDPGSLRPAGAIGRARMRQWTKQLDEGVHAATGVLSTCIAFRHQHFAVKTREEIEQQLARMPDAAKRERQTRNIFDGVESPFFPGALKRFDRLVGDMDTALESGPWLAGDTFSLADVAYAPYAVRLDHLQLGLLWDERPHVAAWYERIRARPAFKTALVDWFNPKYLPLMAEKGQEALPRVRGILAGG